MGIISDTSSAHFAAAIKAICDTHHISQDNLAIMDCVSILEDLPDVVKFKQRIEVKLFVEQEYAPVHGKPYIPLKLTRSFKDEKQKYRNNSYSGTNSAIQRLEIGLGLFELPSIIHQKRTYGIPHIESPIRFWVWMGDQDVYILGDRQFCLVEKPNVFSFLRGIRSLTKDAHAQSAKPPILPQEMINEIYDNSIHFLLKGRAKREEYAKYEIPYKRGIMFSGNPGCVLGNTKIRIRKKSSEGTHKIYDV